MTNKIFTTAIIITLLTWATCALAVPFQNGDFETGDLTGWQLTRFTQIDEATVINDPDYMSNYYAKLNDTDSNGIASIYQTFDINPLATKANISFDFYFAGYDNARCYSDIVESTFAFKSQDNFTGWFDIFDWSLRFNAFETSNGTLNTIVSYSVDYNITLVDETPNAVIQFGLLENSGWCTDKTDTWLGVDNVTVTTNAPVPEPSTILLFLSGIIGLAAFQRKRKQI